MTERLLTSREIAGQLGVSVETVLRWAGNGKLPSVRLSSRAVRFREAAIDAWLEAHETATPVREAPATLSGAADPRVSSLVPAIPPPSAASTEEDT